MSASACTRSICTICICDVENPIVVPDSDDNEDGDDEVHCDGSGDQQLVNWKKDIVFELEELKKKLDEIIAKLTE